MRFLAGGRKLKDPRRWFRGSIWGRKITFGESRTTLKTSTQDHERLCRKVPKGRQHRCPNASQINAKIGIGRNHINHISYDGFKGLQVACANGKRYKKNIKQWDRLLPQIDQNRCENDAWKSDANIIENSANMESQSELKSRNICQKYIQKSIIKYGTKTGHTSDPRWGSGLLPF